MADQLLILRGIAGHDVDGDRIPDGRDATPHDRIVFHHGDHLGSTTVLTNHEGSELSRVLYKPFGAALLEATPANNAVPTFGFTGQRFEANLGLYDYGARWYDPALGRFLSPDSLVPEPGDPQSLNRYSYVRNNPLGRIDPTGNFDEWSYGISAGSGPGSFWSYVSDAYGQFGLPGLFSAPSDYFADLSAYNFDRATNVQWSPDPEFNRWLIDDPVALGNYQSQLNRRRGGYLLSGSAYQFLGETTDPQQLRRDALWSAATGGFGTPFRAGARTLRSARHAAKDLGRYEVGYFDDLQRRSLPGDGLDLHHVGQKHPAA